MYSRCRAQNIVDVERNFFDNFSVFRFVMGSIDPATAEHAAGMFAASGAFFAWLGLSFDVSRRFLDVAQRLAAGRPEVDRFLVRAMAFVHQAIRFCCSTLPVPQVLGLDGGEAAARGRDRRPDL